MQESNLASISYEAFVTPTALREAEHTIRFITENMYLKVKMYRKLTSTNLLYFIFGGIRSHNM